MGILQILLFFSVFSSVYACSSSYCGSFSLHYPFKLEFEKPPDSCTYINLSCNIPVQQLETPVVRLPYGGDFIVRQIGYKEGYIVLYDPGNCLIKRLMKLNLQLSPFRAIDYQTYTFYTCPLSANLRSLNVFPIKCLGNDTSNIVASATLSPDVFLHEGLGCDIFGSWALPVLKQNQFENGGIYTDLCLTWDHLTCSDCEGDDSKNSWTKFVGSQYFLPSFVILVSFLLILFRQMMILITGRNVNPPTADVQLESATAPPGSAAGGLEDSKINSCTKPVVITENRINIDPESDCNTCSICLESYVPQDSVRSITKCDHCFHAECIQMWLRKKGTCPVCRTVLDDGAEL